MVHSLDVVVIGAGVTGLAIALEAQQNGRRVLLLDDAKAHQASAAAAGMIAPLLEALTDAPAADQLDRLADAARFWPSFADRHGLVLNRRGGLWLTSAKGADALAGLHQTFRARGVGFAEQTRAQVADLAPWVDPTGFEVLLHATSDCAVSPAAVLPQMRRRFRDLGGTLQIAKVRAHAGDLILDGKPLQAEAVVIAAGYPGRRLSPVATELERLRPIRGQIAVLEAPDGGPISGPFVRAHGVYVAPQTGGGVKIGATMEEGEDQALCDAAAISDLVRRAATFTPLLRAPDIASHLRAEVGVRAATPDQLPLIGPSRRAGIYLACGMRRNGWLFAPLAAEGIGAYLAGAEPATGLGHFDPRRMDA